MDMPKVVTDTNALRDWFAGMASISVINTAAIQNYKITPETVAELAYKRANAMIEERKKWISQ